MNENFNFKILKANAKTGKKKDISGPKMKLIPSEITS